ncbi:hypothetical protein JZ751_000855 [Albula glossodonta]|uniref:Uncharacterized protein n=1 Tax=Albula glossodonta TaxID=121402 RepID=A0A8T2PXJ6_9TELE|nr:hypothetical protein JZ751_000855 [Albula glossodonta]
MSSPHFSQKKRLLESEAARYHDPGGPFSGLHHLSCVDGPDRFSIITESNFPLQAQHYPSFQNPDPYKYGYDSGAVAGEPVSSPLQKSANHRLYVPRPPCGYDFAVPSYLGSGSYAALYKDPSGSPTPDSDSSMGLPGGSQHGASPLSAHDRGYDTNGKHQGWKQALSKAGDRGEYAQSPSSSSHPFYNSEYLCRYPASSTGPAPAPAVPPPALQTIITTTTKVSYQPCKPAMLKYGDNLYDVKNVAGCGPLLEAGASSAYSDLKAPEDSGVIKSALAYQQESLPKTERADSLETYRCGSYPSYNYPERIVHPFKYDSSEY